MGANRALVYVLRTTVVLLAIIGVGIGLRRTVVLLKPGALSSPKNPGAALDRQFAEHRALTFVHIIPGMLFMVLGPLQFVRGLRTKYPQIHRYSGYVFLTASAIVGLSGLRMAMGKTIGGLDEKAAIILFGSFFLFALGKALSHVLRREFSLHREWMLRGYAVGLAVATIRPIMGTFFALTVMHGQTPDPSKFFGTAFWIGFTLQSIVAETWISYTRTVTVSQPATIGLSLRNR